MTAENTNSQLIAKFQKNSREEVRVSIDDFKGKKLLNIRTWWYDADNEQWAPGRQGISLNVDKFDALATAINKVGEILKQK